MKYKEICHTHDSFTTVYAEHSHFNLQGTFNNAAMAYFPLLAIT